MNVRLWGIARLKSSFPLRVSLRFIHQRASGNTSLKPSKSGETTVSPAVMVLIPYNTVKLPSTHLLSCLHSSGSLKQGSIGSKSNCKQFACCPYCGVASQNQDSAHSHASRHLHHRLLCESCLAFHCLTTGPMLKHLENCEATADLQGESSTPASSTQEASQSGSSALSSSLRESIRKSNKKAKKEQ